VRRRSPQPAPLLLHARVLDACCQGPASVAVDVTLRPVAGYGDIDIDEHDEHGNTALMLACQVPRLSAPLSADVAHPAAGPRRSLEREASPSDPSLRAGQGGFTRIVKMLLRARADPNVVNRKGNTVPPATMLRTMLRRPRVPR
jgi:hypothetical protein